MVLSSRSLDQRGCRPLSKRLVKQIRGPWSWGQQRRADIGTQISETGAQR